MTALGLTLMVAACADNAKTSGGKASGSGSSASGSDAEAGTGSEEGSSSDGSDGSSSGSKPNGSSSGGADTEILGAWCKKAGETEVTGKEVKDMYARFCDGDSPTKLLKDTLIAKAYKGSDKPYLVGEDGKKFKKAVSEGKFTTADFSVGIKLPDGVTAKGHFEKVGPKGGQPDQINKLAEAQEAKGDAKIEKEFAKGDFKYLERGWTVHSTVTKTLEVAGLKKDVVQESKSNSLQFDLDEDGKAYMYVQYVLEGIQGVKDFSLFTANVQLGDDGYLLATIHVEVENQGFAAIAESQVKSTAEKLISTMYDAAKAGK